MERTDTGKCNERRGENSHSQASMQRETKDSPSFAISPEYSGDLAGGVKVSQSWQSARDG